MIVMVMAVIVSCGCKLRLVIFPLRLKKGLELENMLRISVLQFNVTFHVDNISKVGVYWLYVTLHHNNGGPCVPTQPVTINTTCDHKRVSKLVTVDKELTHFNKYINLQLFSSTPSLAPPLPGASSSCILVPFQPYILSTRVAIVFLQDGRCICAGWLMYLCKRHDVFHHKVNGKIFLGLGRMYDGCSAVFCIELDFWAPLYLCINADIHFENLIFEN